MGNDLSLAERVLEDITPEAQRTTRGAAREHARIQLLLKVRRGGFSLSAVSSRPRKGGGAIRMVRGWMVRRDRAPGISPSCPTSAPSHLPVRPQSNIFRTRRLP
jgi:hypothetical protein